MQIVIDITDEIYKKAKESKVDLKALDYLELAVKNGTVLPEQHGRLFDEKDIMNAYEFGWLNLDAVEPILEADEELEKVTREEAIDFLECRRGYYASLSTDPNPYVKATKICGYTLAESANACLMAIEALKLMPNKEESK